MPVTVDEDGLRERITALNIPPGNYQALRLVDDRVFYLRAKEDDGGDEEGPRGIRNPTCAPTASRTAKKPCSAR